MGLTIDRGGGFVLSLNTEALVRGLRPSSKLPRDNEFLTTCNGAVGKDGVLCTIEQLTRMVTTAITDSFPYPQIFVFTNVIIVYSATKVYEWVSGSLVEKLTVTTGYSWSAVDFYDYIYMSNGVVAVERDARSKVYSISSTLPIANTICNNNGQIIVGGLLS